ncbi:MAG: acyl-CoA thioesterase [Desulfovibrionaceae bacterium]
MIADSAFPSPDVWLAHRVSYGETDAMGRVYYGEFFHLFERARGQFIRDYGLSYAEVERRGLLLPVREAGCRYRQPIGYDELIFIRAGVSRWKRASMAFAYEIRDDSKERILATGMTEHACIDPAGKLQRIPQWFRDIFPE